MNIKKHWLKSLAVAAVAAMASANASADVVAAVTANGGATLNEAPMNIPGMKTPAFAHPAGQLVATYSAECYAGEGPPSKSRNLVAVRIIVLDASGNQVATLSPQESVFCSAGSERGTHSFTGVATLPRGTYRVLVRARLGEERASGWVGPGSLVVLR